MSAALKEIQQLLQRNSCTEAEAAHDKFLPGKDKVYGVRVPVLNAIAKQFKSGGFPLVLELWNAGAMEEKLLAAKILGAIAKKDPEQTLKLVKVFSKNPGNWAVCDTIGMQSIKPLLKTHQQHIFDLATQLNTSDNFWERRLSLVLV